jgi:hypothetical protein
MLNLLRFRRFAAWIACSTIASSIWAASPPLSEKALLPQIERLVQLLKDSHAEGYPPGTMAQAINLKHDRQIVLAVFTVEGFGGGNNHTQFLAAFETDSDSAQPYYSLVDVIPVGGKGWCGIEHLNARATEPEKSGQLSIDIDAMDVGPEDAPNFPTIKSVVHLTLNRSRLVESSSVGRAAASKATEITDPAVTRAVEQRRALSTQLLRLAADAEAAGGKIQAMSSDGTIGIYRITAPNAKAAAVANVMQAADVLGKGSMNQQPDEQPGQTRIIVAAGLTKNKLSSPPFRPALSTEWENSLTVANDAALGVDLSFDLFRPAETEKVSEGLARTRVEVNLTGTAGNLAMWVARIHSTESASALLFDGVKLEHREPTRRDARPLKLTGNLYVYRRTE